jgi:hypothetical protein
MHYNFAFFLLLLIFLFGYSGCTLHSLTTSPTSWATEQQVVFEKVQDVNAGASLQKVLLRIRSLADSEEPLQIMMDYVHESGAVTLVSYTENDFSNTLAIDHGKAFQHSPRYTLQELQEATRLAELLVVSPRQIITTATPHGRAFAKQLQIPESEIHVFVGIDILDVATTLVPNQSVVWSVLYVSSPKKDTLTIVLDPETGQIIDSYEGNLLN